MAITAATHAARTALYRLFDAEGVLLYIGIARNPDERMKYHIAFKRWWSEVARTDLEWFGDRAAALAAEAVAIREECPRYNIQVTGEDGVIRIRKVLPELAVERSNSWFRHIGGTVI